MITMASHYGQQCHKASNAGGWGREFSNYWQYVRKRRREIIEDPDLAEEAKEEALAEYVRTLDHNDTINRGAEDAHPQYASKTTVSNYYGADYEEDPVDQMTAPQSTERLGAMDANVEALSFGSHSSGMAPSADRPFFTPKTDTEETRSNRMAFHAWRNRTLEKEKSLVDQIRQNLMKQELGDSNTADQRRSLPLPMVTMRYVGRMETFQTNVLEMIGAYPRLITGEKAVIYPHEDRLSMRATVILAGNRQIYRARFKFCMPFGVVPACGDKMNSVGLDPTAIFSNFRDTVNYRDPASHFVFVNWQNAMLEHHNSENVHDLKPGWSEIVSDGWYAEYDTDNDQTVIRCEEPALTFSRTVNLIRPIFTAHITASPHWPDTA